jgi:hypothetical protein
MKSRAMIDDMMADVKNNRALILEDAYVGKGLTDGEIDAIEAQHGVRLMRGVRSYYRQLNGVIVKWRLDSAKRIKSIKRLHADYDEPICGIVNMCTLEEIMVASSELFGSVWDEQMDAFAKAELACFRPFDRNVEEALVGLLCRNGQIRDSLYFLTKGAKYLVDMRADLARYLRALCQSRGFLWWQESFALRPGGIGRIELCHYISQLFPAENFSEFE